ncbi:MAG: glycine-rich protein, partial [Myxococcota bacterium]|nr:glycine-rich protein [Myxococcota bacterium]
VTDADLETTTDSYIWENQSRGTMLSTDLYLELSTSNAAPTDVIACSFTATDPSGGSVTDTVTSTVANQPPTIDSLSLSQTSLAMGDTIGCVSAESDPEGDIPSVSYSWSNETQGSVIGSGASITITPSMATGLDEISCTVTATDSYGDTDTERVSILLDETVPEFTTDASISPGTGVTTSSTLSCTGVAVDPDGGAITLSYSWANGSTTIGSTQSITLSPTTTQPTDVLSCLITATDPSGEQATSSASVMVENTAPILGSVSISPSSSVDTTTTLTCAASNSDADLESLSTTYAWSNGSTALGSGASLSLTPSLAQPADSIVCTATVVDSYGASASDTASVTISNTPPVIDSIAVIPTTSYNDSTLTCNVVASDADNQALDVAYTWTNVTAGTSLGTASSLTLDGSIASRLDEIECSASVTDASGDVISDSISLTLGNREPSSPTVTLTPNPAYIDSLLTCAPSGSSDDDGDSITYEYAWSVNGSSLTETGNTLSSGFIATDVVSCTVTPSDGLLSGTAGQSSITIDNRAPSIDSITLSPDPLYTDDHLVATVASSDADGDSLALSYSWYGNGTIIQTGSDNTLHYSLFSKEDEIEVSVTADDGNDTSAPATASIICANTPPTAPTVSVLPTEPIELVDDITCSISVDGTDLDGDSLSYSFAWSVDGADYTGASSTANSSVVPASDIVSGEEWICTATPNDGTDEGTGGSASVTVQSDWQGQLTFTNCGQTGYSGPSQSQCDSEYAGGTLDSNVTVSNGIQVWTVPSDGSYFIAAYGAQGGANNDGYNASGWDVRDGGHGAYVSGTFSLNAGDELHILVGQQGEGAATIASLTNAGGGGGTFVSLNDDPLIVAGGGGGAGNTTSTNPTHAHGTTSESGQTAPGHQIPGAGGTGGYGGAYGMSGSSQRYGGAGGGGFYGDGDDSDGYGACSGHTGGGAAYLNGGEGGVWGCGNY